MGECALNTMGLAMHGLTICFGVLQLIKKFGEELYGSSCNVRRTNFFACNDFLELHPQTWSDGFWSVFSLQTNAVSV